MADKGKNSWDGLCDPCQKVGVCATGSVHCEECRNIFCANCSKLHKANEAGRRHTLAAVVGIEESTANKQSLDITGFRFDQFGNEEKDMQKVRYGYIKAISTDHDHTKDNYPDEMFCLRHREVVCKNCKFRKHSLCTNCVSVQRASEVLVESGQYLQLISRLKKCHEVSNSALQETRKEKNLLSSKEMFMVKNIQDLKNAIFCRVNKLENELLETIYNSSGNALQNLGKAENILLKIKNRSESMMDAMKKNLKDGIDQSSFKTSMDYHTKGVLFMNMMGRLSDYCQTDKLFESELESGIDVDKVCQRLGSLGNLNVSKFDSQLPSILQSTHDNPFIEVAENELSMVFGSEGSTYDDIYLDSLMDKFSKTEKVTTRWSDPDYLKYGIVGIICLDMDTLLVLDRTSCSVMLIDRFGSVLSSHEFPCIPWAMDLYSENAVIISIPGENKIVFIAVDCSSFILQKEIKCSAEPSAITGYQDAIYVCSYPWSDRAAVYKLGGNGKETNIIDKDKSGKRLFKAPLDIALDRQSGDVFVCDAGLKILMAFNQDLQETFRIDLEYMGHPSSLALDSFGDIYICGKLSNVIYKVSTTKHSGKIVFTEEDGISRPQAICNIAGEKSLCVLCARDNIFKIFKIS